MTLSPKHIQVRDFILQYQAEHNEKPAYKVIMDKFAIKSTDTAFKIIRQLKDAGELSGPVFEVPSRKKSDSDRQEHGDPNL